MVGDVHLHHIPKFGFEDHIHLCQDVCPLDRVASVTGSSRRSSRLVSFKPSRILDKGLLAGLKLVASGLGLIAQPAHTA